MNITKKHLECALNILNDSFGYSREAYMSERDTRGGLVSNDGTYVLDWAYGGVRLCQMCKNGGERDISKRGTKRECLTYIRLFTDGADAMKKVLP
jgi:hypothetical protein